VARIVQRPDVALSARGVEQTRRLAARLAKRRVGAIVSSDLRRAVMTAETLRDRIPVPLTLDPGLRERDYGDVRGTAYADLGTDIFAPDYSPPNGETWAAFHARVADAWTRIQAIAGRTDGYLVVVTHGLVCHAVATRHVDLPPGTSVGMGWTHTSVTEIDGPPYRMARLVDCSAHLLAASDAAGPV
jgi:2,3-bisphosphoglycerate-dependent phosphoglycerate mutase